MGYKPADLYQKDHTAEVIFCIVLAGLALLWLVS